MKTRSKHTKILTILAFGVLPLSVLAQVPPVQAPTKAQAEAICSQQTGGGAALSGNSNTKRSGLRGAAAGAAIGAIAGDAGTGAAIGAAAGGTKRLFNQADYNKCMKNQGY